MLSTGCILFLMLIPFKGKPIAGHIAMTKSKNMKSSAKPASRRSDAEQRALIRRVLENLHEAQLKRLIEAKKKGMQVIGHRVSSKNKLHVVSAHRSRTKGA